MTARAAARLAPALVLAVLCAVPRPSFGDIVEVPDLDDVERAELEAPTAVWKRAVRKMIAEGGVTLRLDHTTILAERLEIDLAARQLMAAGRVRLGGKDARLSADRLTVDLDAKTFIAAGVNLDVLEGGRTRMRLRAGKLLYQGEGQYDADEVSFTPCGCEGTPAWSISAVRALVEEGEGTWLFLPVLRIQDVPVLPLPVLYAPLGDRRTGLLMPQVGWSGHRGLEVAQPLFVTLGRSWDTTFTPGFFSGRDPAFASRRVISGPHVEAEVRYTPTRRTRGTVTGFFIWDTQPQDLNEVDSPARGPRGRLRWEHETRLDDGGFGAPGHGLDLDAHIVSDSAWPGDLAVRLEGIQVGFLRSVGRLFVTPHRTTSAEVGGLFLQDLRCPTMRVVGGDITGNERNWGVNTDCIESIRDGALRTRPLFGVDRGAPVTFQPAPTLHLTTTPLGLPGRVFGQLAVHGARWGIPGRAFDDAGADGLNRGDLGWCRPEDCDPTENDGIFNDGELATFEHLRLDASLARGLSLGRFLVGELSLAVAGDLWHHAAVGDVATRTVTRFYPRADAVLGTGLVRRFGEWRHRVEPRLRWRYVPLVETSVSGPSVGELTPALSPWGLPVPELGLHQVIAEVENRFVVDGHPWLRATVAQALDVGNDELGEAMVRAEVVSPNRQRRLFGDLAWDWTQGMLTRAWVGARFTGEQRSSVSVSWHYLAATSSDWLRAGLDELFRGGALPSSRFETLQTEDVAISELVAAFNAPVLDTLNLRYTVRMDLVASDVARAPQHVLGVDWKSDCDCWAMSLSAIWPPNQPVPNLVFNLELAELGAIR